MTPVFEGRDVPNEWRIGQVAGPRACPVAHSEDRGRIPTESSVRSSRAVRRGEIARERRVGADGARHGEFAWLRVGRSGSIVKRGERAGP